MYSFDLFFMFGISLFSLFFFVFLVEAAINSQKQLIYHRAAMICILLICFSCLVFLYFLCFGRAVASLVAAEAVAVL